MDETYLIRVKKLKPIWERLGFSSEKKHVAKSEKICYTKVVVKSTTE